MGSKCSKCKSNLTSSNISNCSLSNIEKNPELIQKDSIIQLAEEDSILNLEKIITKRPNNPDLLLKLASSLYEKGLSSQSCECYHNFIQQGYTLDTNSSILYAQILVQNKNYDSALEVLTKTLENNADDHKVHGFLGEIYYILEINDKSYYHTKEALRINDKVSEYHNNYGLCMMKEKKYSEALDHFLKAYELDHHMAKALNNAGNAHRKLGNIVEAKKCYTTAIDLIPRRKFPIALINLATAYFYTGDTLQALNHFEEALQTGSNIHKIMVKKGYHLLFKSPKTKSGIELLFKKDYTKSISILSEVLESDSNNPVVNYYIALALVKSSQINESTQYYRKTIE
jgi:tetratricopeptide (TPR) repeat protein